jgi:hypothetical protein
VGPFDFGRGVIVRTRVIALISVAVLAPALLAPTCGQAPASIQIFAPGTNVPDYDVRVQIQILANTTFDPASDVKLNGVPILVTQDVPGSLAYSATRSPGFPLLDQNLLEVRYVRLSGAVVTATRAFSYTPPKAHLRQITNAADLIQGPLADGRIGDWLFENSVARFIVQDVAKRDIYSVGGFGGNLIDVELKANPGNDNFLEIQPMLNIETVVNAQTLEVVNDGQDGTPAILRTCGPDDLLDFVNPSSTIADGGLAVPPNLDDNDQPVEACTEYRLDALVPWVRMETTVTNLSGDEQRMLVGDWYNPAGQLEAWVRPNRLGEALSSDFSVFSHFGYDEFAGLDYALTTLPLSAIDFPGAASSSQFTTSGVTVILHSTSVLQTLLGADPVFFLAGEATGSFTRYVGVGDGSGSNGVAMEKQVRGLASATIQGCITVAGAPLPGSRVSAIRGTVTNVNRQEVSVVTDATPCSPGNGTNYEATITLLGPWQVAASRRGSPYEGSLALPTLHATGTTVANGVYTVNIDLPASGRLSAHVTDEGALPLPARVSVVGVDPSPPIIKEGAGLPGLGSSLLGLFEDPKEGLPYGIVAFGYSDVNGDVAFDVEPGSYQLVVSRGTEYSVHSAPVTITAGATTSVTPQIARVLDTAGFVSSDFHVHGIRSADSRVADGPRVAQFAGEGVENIIMTDHHVHTNLTPTITSLGLGGFVTSTVGEEITTFDYGHFNGYPFTIDPSVPSGGSTDWGQAAPPGEDFPSAGALNATPAVIHALATGGARATADTTIQINHIDSHFAPLQIDTSVAGEIGDELNDLGRAGRRLPDTTAIPNLFHHFPALELWNGADRAQQENFLLERIGIWFNHLNKGLRTTAISDTDTHTFGDLESAGARTWTAASTDLVPGIDGGEVARSVDAGRAVGGQGIYVQTRLTAASTLETADLTLGGSTDLSTTDGELNLEIRVQAPLWAQFDRIDVYANGLPAPDAKGSSSPYLFSAEPPAVSLLEGDCDPDTLDAADGGDFDITTVSVHPIPGGQRQEVTLNVPFTGLTQDTWFAVVVSGTDGVCEPMFPVYPRSLQHDAVINATTASLLDGNLGQLGTMALGVANALYANVDGVPGFQPPNP